MIDYFVMALRRTFDFKGRSRRREYWYFLLTFWVVSVIIEIIELNLPPPEQEIPSIIKTIVGYSFLIPHISLLIRRLHDIGKSGWWSLVFLIPIVNIIMTFVWLIRDSDDDNQYGPNPKYNVDSEAWLAQFE
jgi:uncharacterized membrane protein YhaH (DUF805 family)